MPLFKLIITKITLAREIYTGIGIKSYLKVSISLLFGILKRMTGCHSSIFKVFDLQLKSLQQPPDEVGN